MDAAERAREQQQQLFDVETASTTDDKEHLRQLGLSTLDAVLSKAQTGQDPWEYQQQPGRPNDTAADGEADVHDADVAAMGAWLEKHKPLLLMGGYVVAQGSSWVLMKGSLMSTHTPAVLTFLHLLSAGLMQLLLVAWGAVPAPQVSAAAAKGAIMPAAVSALQLLLVMWVLEHSSVYLLLCWLLVVPLLLGVTRAAHVAKRSWLQPLQASQLPWLAAAAAGLGLEVLLDRNARSVLAYILLLVWTSVVVLDMVWQQIKVDATLGHIIMEPEFLFRARELSDLEEALSPSSKALLTSALPTLPVLLLGLISLEAKDLVDHEPSVPTLEVLLLSCLAYAAVHSLTLLLAGCLTLQHSHVMMMQSAAAVVAAILELMERGHTTNYACLLGVILSIAGCGGSQLMSQGRLKVLQDKL